MKKHLLLLCFGLFGFTAYAQNSIPNGTFETWTSNTLNNPQYYPYTSNSQTYLKQGVFNVTKTTDSYHGLYGVQLATTTLPGDTAFAYFVNISPGSTSPTSWHGGMPYNQMPTGIKGYYQYNMATADSGTMIITFSHSGTNIRTYFLKVGGIHATYTPFQFTLNPALAVCGLANDDVWNIQIDSQGNLWFGTNGGGVSKYDGSHWTTYTTANGLASNTIHSILIDGSGNYWFGTNAGVSKFNGNNWTTYTTTDGLANNDVYGIQTDASGNLWFGTMGGGVSKFDGSTTWTTFTTADSLVNNNVRTVRKDAQGNMWFGTTGGVSKYNGTKNKKWTTYTTVEGLANNDVRHIQTDGSGNLWFATYGGGVSKFNGTSTWTTFNVTNTSNGLASDLVNKIVLDPQNNKWIGTQGGVSKFDGSTWTPFTTANGLVNNSVSPIVIDSKGNKWFGTIAGVSKFDGNNWTTYTNAITTTPDSVEFGALSCKFSPPMQEPRGVAGGILKLDSVSFTGVSSQPDKMNGDFELWQSQIISFPAQWYAISGSDQETGVTQTSDAVKGNYAIELKTYLGDQHNHPAAQGAAISTGYYPSNCNGGCYLIGGFPYSNKKDTLVFSYKYAPMGNDSAIVNLNFKKNGSIVFITSTYLHASASYQEKELPFDFEQTPDTVIVSISSSVWQDTLLTYVGSDLKIDEIYFKSQRIITGIDPLTREIDKRINIFPNPSNGKFQITSSEVGIQKLEIYDALGKVVYSNSEFKQQKSNEIDLSQYQKGIYFIKIYDGIKYYTEKIVIK
jgi:streptogramin lyase